MAGNVLFATVLLSKELFCLLFRYFGNFFGEIVVGKLFPLALPIFEFDLLNIFEFRSDLPNGR